MDDRIDREARIDVQPVQHSADISVGVNTPQLVRLYDVNGRTIQVLSTELDSFLREGWRKNKIDIDAAAQEVRVRLPAMERAVDALITEVVQDKRINLHPEAAMATALMAVNDYTKSFMVLVTDLRRLYPEHTPDDQGIK